MQNEPLAPTVTPTWSQMDACISEAKTEWHRRTLVVMRYTGLRINQVLGLLWSDLDLSRQMVTIRPELGKTRAEKTGRTQQSARIWSMS